MIAIAHRRSRPAAGGPLPMLLTGLALALFLTLAPASAWCGTPISQETDSASIRKELERFRVLYTEDHPDVQRMERHLERALQLEAEQRAEARKKAAAKKAREEALKARQAPQQ